MADITKATAGILATRGCKIIHHWLMLLEAPGDWMVFVPADIGLGAHSIQIYVNALSVGTGVRYAVRNGAKNDPGRNTQEPVYVMRVQLAEEK